MHKATLKINKKCEVGNLENYYFIFRKAHFDDLEFSFTIEVMIKIISFYWTVLKYEGEMYQGEYQSVKFLKRVKNIFCDY